MKKIQKVLMEALILMLLLILVSCASTESASDPYKEFLSSYSYSVPSDGYPVSKDGYRYADYIASPSQVREDFPNLTDEEYVNFRMVTTTGMGTNLYRGSSPINSFLGRTELADKAIANHGIKTIINFGNSQEKAEGFEAYKGSYYSSSDVKKVYLSTKWMPDTTTFKTWYPSKDSEGFQKSMATVFRTIATEEGPYFIHCTWGRDRTGISIAVLEALMGASWDEIKHDYILSYYNFFGITEDSEEGQQIIRYQIQLQLAVLFHEADLANADLQICAANYMKGLGLSDSEIEQIKVNLSK